MPSKGMSSVVYMSSDHLLSVLVQEAAGGAGGSSHAERATEGHTATCTSQQSR